MSEIAEILSEFAHSTLSNSAINAREIMQLSVLDWCAVSLRGIPEPASRITREIAIAEGGQGRANIFGAPGLFPARAAALVNGTTSHALDYDDTHFAHIGHPSVAIIPAAMAIAQENGCSLGAFLDAVLVGCEASVRFGIWLGRGHYQIGFHQTATAGAFGACTAAARLSGLNPAQTMQALALTASSSAGLKAQFGSMTKPYHAGQAAQTGVTSTRLAQAGFSAQVSAIEAFGTIHSGENHTDAFSQVGQEWLFENVSHKFHACCHGTHAMIEALTTINPPINPRKIKSLRIETHSRWMNVCNILTPKTGLEVKFSYRHIAAMVLNAVETASLENYSDVIATDQSLVDLAAKAQVVAVPDISETASRVTIVLTNGPQVKVEYDLNQPMHYQTRQKKIIAKAQVLLGQDQTETLWQKITLDPNTPIASLTESLFQTST